MLHDRHDAIGKHLKAFCKLITCRAAVRPKVNRDGTAPLQPVVVDVLVDETGVAFGAKLDQLRSGLVELEDAAIAAALSARFEPGTRRGHATTSWTKVLVQFEPAPGVVALSG